MLPVKVILDKYYKGDSWSGMDISVTMNGSPPLSAVQSCRMQFRTRDGDFGYELNSVITEGMGSIVISDASLWDIIVPPQILNLDTGRWYWDFEITDNSNNVYTVMYGILKIIGDITYG
jgi:hypothetical protein